MLYTLSHFNIQATFYSFVRTLNKLITGLEKHGRKFCLSLFGEKAKQHPINLDYEFAQADIVFL